MDWIRSARAICWVDVAVMVELVGLPSSPSAPAAVRKRLHPDWQARLVGRTESHFVAVDVDPADGRMELLLDQVADWASEVGLRSVPSHVGEKMSMVFAKEPDDTRL